MLLGVRRGRDFGHICRLNAEVCRDVCNLALGRHVEPGNFELWFG